MVQRVYVERKPGFQGEAEALCAELRDIVGVTALQKVRLLNRYDVEGLTDELFEACIPTVLSEPQSDDVTFEAPAETPGVAVFAVEPLPGQFDQRASSASECIELMSQQRRPEVRTAVVYVLEGNLSQNDIATIKHYVINPVEAREASLEPRTTLAQAFEVPAKVETIEGFTTFTEAELETFIQERGLAMDVADALMCRSYFAEEGRNPTLTEIKMIDTYWSDHCRHTTFGTELDEVAIADAHVQEAFSRYLDLREQLGRTEKPLCLMDMGTIGARYLKHEGILQNLDESEEINACTVKVKVDVNGEEQDWLYLFKNETHNHPTEIEPFGGAATCVGGAIRDPLSGRAYVYQAMRVTGAADPTVPVSETLPGKLPQRKLVTTAAAGYSSYGNQIGLATGQVNELYHPGYAAKRMEIGAVVGAAPASHVRRETPAPGDVIVLLGGRTGRDGIGGATGSSKAHSVESLESCGAEVQKGNAPVERKIQRLFRRGEACRLIKRCNDFGAGGVSVAIGELADGLDINLDAVPKKYEGLDGTELALSESQERMAVALAPEDVETFLSLAREENLEATPVAVVTEEPRVRMSWRGDNIVDVSREFLASNGAAKHAEVFIPEQGVYERRWEGATLESRMANLVADLNVAGNKGLVERFDSTIGAATVLMPFGGKNQLTPAQAMVSKFPVLGETTTVSGMAWGFNPYISEVSPFAGAYVAVVESIAKLVATGFKRENMYLTFQEYFEKLRTDAARWGKPVAAVLGALEAQLDFGVGAIGGKDSMSGSFEELDVPPTLVSFATAVGSVEAIVSPEFKRAGNQVVVVRPALREGSVMPEAAAAVNSMNYVQQLIETGVVAAAATPGYGGFAETLFKMGLGNGLGLNMSTTALTLDDLFVPAYGSFVLEVPESLSFEAAPAGVSIEVLGEVTEAYTWRFASETFNVAPLQEAWEHALEGVFPYRSSAEEKAEEVPTLNYEGAAAPAYHGPALVGTEAGKPRVVIPVFPGTNCEFDSAAAFERAGARATTFVINNLTPEAVAESTRELARLIRESHMVMLPGGFSGGDEPDGSAKFITAFFRAPEVTEAVRELLQARDGLMLGICNGFQALVKLGLVPYGDIRPMDAECATLTFNNIGRHQSMLVRTRVASTMSPWMSRMQVGDIHTIAISHGEGKFVAPPTLLDTMVLQGQVAAQYVNAEGVPSMDLQANPNGSAFAIEAVTSPCGRVLGKMGHTERSGAGLYKNAFGNTYQPLIEGGVSYFL